MKRLQAKLSYANVTSTVALFLVLAGGTAFAATTMLPKNSIGSKQLKRNSVTAAKIKKGAVTGPKINLSTLGTVPNASHAATADSAANASHAARADSAGTAESAARATTAGDAATLGGNPPRAFLQGGGQFISFRRELPVGATDVPLTVLPGLGRLLGQCEAGTTYPRGGFKLLNESGSTMEETLQYAGGVDGGTAADGEYFGFGEQEHVDAVTVQMASRSTPSAVATLNLSLIKNGNAVCVLFGQATVSDNS